MKGNEVILNTRTGDKRGQVDSTRWSVTSHYMNSLAIGTGR